MILRNLNFKLLEVLDVVLDDFMIILECVSEGVEDVPVVVLHDFTIVVLPSVIFAVSLNQYVLVELDEPRCELLDNRRCGHTHPAALVRQIFERESNQIGEREGVIDFPRLKGVAEVNEAHEGAQSVNKEFLVF